MSIEPPAAPSPILSWSACIPTLNRVDILKINISCLLRQTRPPKQIVVIDASEDAEEHRRLLMPMFSGTSVEFVLQRAEAKSSAVQRNQGLAFVTSEIVVFMDDDSLLFEYSAENFMKIFERDLTQEIAGLAIKNVDEIPLVAKKLLQAKLDHVEAPSAIEQKKRGVAENKIILKKLAKWALWRFFRREILMQAMDNMFVPYDYYRQRASNNLKSEGLVVTRHLPGYGMAVRTHVARVELFNSFLLAYCPCEDLDASYRYGRHGICAYAPDCHLKHYEVEGSRITRMQATSLGISNVAFFVHTNSDSPVRHRISFSTFVARRLLGEALKDLLARRLSFPQARGVLAAIPRSFKIFRLPLPEAQKWYVESQRAFLYKGKLL